MSVRGETGIWGERARYAVPGWRCMSIAEAFGSAYRFGLLFKQMVTTAFKTAAAAMFKLAR